MITDEMLAIFSASAQAHAGIVSTTAQARQGAGAVLDHGSAYAPQKVKESGHDGRPLGDRASRYALIVGEMRVGVTVAALG